MGGGRDGGAPGRPLNVLDRDAFFILLSTRRVDRGSAAQTTSAGRPSRSSGHQLPGRVASSPARPVEERSLRRARQNLAEQGFFEPFRFRSWKGRRTRRTGSGAAPLPKNGIRLTADLAAPNERDRALLREEPRVFLNDGATWSGTRSITGDAQGALCRDRRVAGMQSSTFRRPGSIVAAEPCPMAAWPATSFNCRRDRPGTLSTAAARGYAPPCAGAPQSGRSGRARTGTGARRRRCGAG